MQSSFFPLLAGYDNVGAVRVWFHAHSVLLTYGTSSKLQWKRTPIEGDGKDLGQKIIVFVLIYRKACLIRNSSPTYSP